VGIQSALLSHVLASPLFIDSITVGRKFSEPHARRALCCRLQDFSYGEYQLHSILRDEVSRSEKGSEVCELKDVEFETAVTPHVYRTHHPVLRQTAVKLDKGAIIAPATAPAPPLSRNLQQRVLMSAVSMSARPWVDVGEMEVAVVV
jgi:hypothetical protein